MSERTQGPWKWHSRIEDLDGRGPLQTGSIYAEPTKGHAYSVAVAPKYQTEQRWKADAAAIVLWENHFDELVKALDQALRQWKMYAEIHDRDGWLSEEPSPEGDMFREIKALLAKVKQ
jgi:hypothetical protein